MQPATADKAIAKVNSVTDLTVKCGVGAEKASQGQFTMFADIA
jgi:hypothetical protein